MPPASSLLDSFDQSRRAIESAQKILIISHKNPDADSVGANVALREELEALGKSVDSACVDPVPQNCRFLIHTEKYLADFRTEDYDLVITVDCGSHDLMKFHERKPELLDRSRVFLINIDHHASNDFFGNVNVVSEEAASTCLILYLMFAYFGWKLTPEIATALFHGLCFDTGGFMHSNTTADTLRVGARLKAGGADSERSVKELFHKQSLTQLKLWGRALSRADLNQNKSVTSVITRHDFEDLKMDVEDLSGLVSYLNHVPEADFCLLLTEDKKGQIKGSFRTLKENIDCAKMASLFGGGGHKKAAGFSIPGRIQARTEWKIQTTSQN